MDKEKNKYQPQELLDNIPNNFFILQEGIDLGVEEEYFHFAEGINFNKYYAKQIIEKSKVLFLEDTSIESKKEALILLAHLGTVEAYRIIEKYLNTNRKELESWALLSLQECRVFLENDLLEENTGFISTGLGGKANKLRYYFIISSKNELPFSEVQKNLIQDKFKYVCMKHNSEIEEINFQKNYSIVKILISMDVAVGNIIEEGIEECNKVGNFIYFHYYVTNVSKPTKEEIIEYLKELKKTEI